MSAKDFYNDASKDQNNNNVSSYNRPSQINNDNANANTGNNQQERGFMSTALGGAGGYYAGTKISNNNSKLSGVLGAVGGAYFANKISDKLKHHNGNHHHNGRSRSGMMDAPPHPPPQDNHQNSNNKYGQPPPQGHTFGDSNPGRFQGDPRLDDRQEYMDNNQQYYYNQGSPPPHHSNRW